MITIWTDGSCLKNPGGFGAAAVLIINPDGSTIKVVETAAVTTNNRMELLAIKLALQLVFCKQNFDRDITIHSDSKYAINCLNGSYKPKVNIDLIEPCLSMLTRLSKVDLVWVKGHSGLEHNETVDKMAYSAALEYKYKSEQ